MLVWQDAILYGFLAYLLIHLIVDDIVYLYKSINGRQNANRFEVEPIGVYYGDIEMCDGNLIDSKLNTISHNGKRASTNPSEQRTIILLFCKLCDIVMYCVMGYFKTFTTCWVATLDCLNCMISKYIAFLDSMVKNMTAAPAVIVLSIAAVVSLAIAAVIVWIVMPSPHGG